MSNYLACPQVPHATSAEGRVIPGYWEWEGRQIMFVPPHPEAWQAALAREATKEAAK